MTSYKPLVLVLGAGLSIGQTVAKKFVSDGYSVALAARSLSERRVSNQEWTYTIDLSNPGAVEALFTKVSEDVGIPNVVIFNAFSLLPSKDHPFAVSVWEFENSLKVNMISTYAAAKCAVEGFDKLPKSMLKSFLYTGNILNTTTMPVFLALGVGKSASSHIIQSGASAYAEKGYCFYYVDERKEDGSPIGSAISGQAHADYFFELAAKPDQGPWLSTFVNGKGYTKFD
ncbi:hypothetical protein OIDMADRAFT_35864 [Oidiodendron maius Zn]|uniref:Short-chain dehydrogenase n=1 Tax=Oidiodendron maius (strain Zn) TaxID=913774 RepID=A0A0C3C397_OIDMZ|nr:hypothetical protein OIDMADRAFT_35864 [Oidiodendron maius Zn]